MFGNPAFKWTVRQSFHVYIDDGVAVKMTIGRGELMYVHVFSAVVRPIVLTLSDI